MIVYNKSILFTNNKYKKVWTLNGQDILWPKNKKKIMVLNFLLP